MVGDAGFEPTALCATCISCGSHGTLRRMAPVLAEASWLLLWLPGHHDGDVVGAALFVGQVYQAGASFVQAC